MQAHGSLVRASRPPRSDPEKARSNAAGNLAIGAARLSGGWSDDSRSAERAIQGRSAREPGAAIGGRARRSGDDRSRIA